MIGTWTWRAAPDSLDLSAFIRLVNQRMNALAALLAPPVRDFAEGDTTPSVEGARIWRVKNAGATNIIALKGSAGEEVLLWSTTANTTLVHSAALLLKGGVNVLMTATETRRFASIDGVNWREI